MTKKDRKGAKESSRTSLMGFVLGALVLAGMGVWIFEAMSSRPAAPPAPPQPIPASVQWTPLVSQELGFSVSMPAPPQNMSAVASGGDIGPESTWSATYEGGTIMLKVLRCPEKLCKRVPDALLDGTRKGTLEELGGTLVSEQRLELPCPQGTCRAMEFEVTSRQGLHVSTRVVITRNRIFQVMGTESSGSTGVFRRVVDSFTFL